MNLLSSLKNFVCTSLCTLMMAGTVSAAELGSAAEAEALVKKAVALINSAGPDKAFDTITSGQSLKDRDLYITVLDLNGKNLAHGANSRLVGKDLIGMKDPDGKPIVQMFVDVAKTKGKGWTENYKYLNPVTQKIEVKAMYIERVGDILVGSGVYKN